MESLESTTLSLFIPRSAGHVYAFASNPAHLPRWAPGLCRNIRQEGGVWLIDTPDGVVALRFAEPNSLGVLDHWVIPAPGVEVYVPMRVVAAGEGSLVLFTLFRLPGMDDGAFAADQALVLADLNRLRDLLETED